MFPPKVSYLPPKKKNEHRAKTWSMMLVELGFIKLNILIDNLLDVFKLGYIL